MTIVLQFYLKYPGIFIFSDLVTFLNLLFDPVNLSVKFLQALISSLLRKCRKF